MASDLDGDPFELIDWIGVLQYIDRFSAEMK